MTIGITNIQTLGAWPDVRRRLAPAAPPPALGRDTFVRTPAPAAPAALPKPKPAGPLAGFKLKPGSTFAIAPGTTVKGYPVTGTAKVVAVSGDKIEMRMQGAAAGGFVNFDVRFKAAAQPDGSVKLVADMLDPQGGPGQRLLDQQAKVVKAADGDLRLRVADGKQARLMAVGPSLRIQVAEMDVNLVRTA